MDYKIDIKTCHVAVLESLIANAEKYSRSCSEELEYWSPRAKIDALESLVRIDELREELARRRSAPVVCEKKVELASMTTRQLENLIRQASDYSRASGQELDHYWAAEDKKEASDALSQLGELRAELARRQQPLATSLFSERDGYGSCESVASDTIDNGVCFPKQR